MDARDTDRLATVTAEAQARLDRVPTFLRPSRPTRHLITVRNKLTGEVSETSVAGLPQSAVDALIAEATRYADDTLFEIVEVQGFGRAS